MVPIFIASNRDYSGKTFVALGLALKLIDQGHTAGYIKPVSRTPVKKGNALLDADAALLKEALSLEDTIPNISPFILGYETQNHIYSGKIKDAKKQILSAVKSLAKKDFVIIEGSNNLFDYSLINADSLDLIKDLKAKTLLVESWTGDSSADSIYGISRVIGEKFSGAVINRVPASAYRHVTETVKPFLEKKGIKIPGVFLKDSVLESFSVRQLIELLNGKVLCCEDRLDEFVEYFSIGAMDVDSALVYFRRTPNKAVITGAHRSDIQLAALETSTKCIILTGGYNTNDVVIAKAQSKGVPIISVSDDTFTTVEKIETVTGKTRLRGPEKIARAKELFERGFDMKKFFKGL